MCLVIRAHHAQSSHLVVGEFVVGVTMLWTEDATGPCMASRRAVRLGLDSIRQAFANIPSRGKGDSACRTGADTASRSAGRTRIEAHSIAGSVQGCVGQ